MSLVLLSFQFFSWENFEKYVLKVLEVEASQSRRYFKKGTQMRTSYLYTSGFVYFGVYGIHVTLRHFYDVDVRLL